VTTETQTPMTRGDLVLEYVRHQYKSHIRSVQEMRGVLDSIEARLAEGKQPSTVELAVLTSKASHFAAEVHMLIGREMAANYIEVK
jgi:hypothetical protein